MDIDIKNRRRLLLERKGIEPHAVKEEQAKISRSKTIIILNIIGLLLLFATPAFIIIVTNNLYIITSL